MRPILLRTAAALALAAILGACTQKNTGDEQALQADAAASAAASVAVGIDRLLLFPNPIGTDPFALDGGTFETNTSDYAIAYYAAIDPNNGKDTLDKWRKQNAFVGYADPARQGQGTEHLAVFRDVKDLGYGRRMTGRFNSDDKSVAFYVENYNVAPGGVAGYSSELNVDAAIRRDTQWHVGTNAIEWSATPCLPSFDPTDCDSTVKFAKYYNFSSVDGTRQLAVDLDGHGKKAMPGPCITCHGGRGDPLTPPDAAGNKRFPLVENSLSRKRGDVQARLHGQNVDSFGFSVTQPGFAKSDMQPILKDFNQWILCTYPTPTAASVTGPSWGSCNRPLAGVNEWQGTAGPMIESWYGGPGMSAPTFSDTYIPAADATGNGWNSNTAIPGTAFTDTALYQNVVAPYCRTCHILRGTKNQSDIDFRNFGVPAAGATLATGFLSYADRIKVHVFDRGNMPLAQIPHSDFWNSSAPQMLASFIDAQLGAGSATSNGVPLMPGRPIADPGPDRMVRTGANAVLTGENSLFATTFSWSLDPTGPQTATINNPNSMVAIFNASVATANVPGNVPYKVVLTVDGGVSKSMNVTVDDNFPDPLNIKFAQVKNVLQNIQHGGTAFCPDCHRLPTGSIFATTRVPPIWYSSTLALGGDRDGDGLVNTTDDEWFRKALSGRVNLTEIAASALLRKPTGNHHNGLKVIDTSDTSTGVAGGLRNYSILYNWILAGMQPGGVAANSVINPSNTLTFSGTPLYSSSIALNGATSIGATNFLWTVLPGAPIGPTGAPAIISNPTSPSAVLNVPNVGNYVVQLHVDDGISSDAVLQTVTVSEPAISTDFNPQTGSVTVTSPSAGTGNIVLSSTSAYVGAAGTPVNCHWEVLSGPAGAFLDGSAVLDITKPCGSNAILNVPTSAAGGIYSVRLTASGVNPGPAVTHDLTVSSSAPTPVISNTPSPQALQFFETSTTSIQTHSTLTGGTLGSATISVVTATASLTGTGSTTPTGTLKYSWCVLPFQQPDATNYPASLPVCPTKTAPSPSAATTMTVGATGTYGVQLTVDNGFASATASLPVIISTRLGTSFPSIISTVTCGSTCHLHTSPPLAGALFNPASGSTFAPPWDNAATADGLSLYKRIMQRVSVGAPATSHLLTCPQSGCFTMGGYAWTPGTNPYDSVLKWIQDGAPPGN